MVSVGSRRRLIFRVLLILCALTSGIALVWFVTYDVRNTALQLSTGTAFTLAMVGFIWLTLDPDTQGARQSDELLKLSSQMLDASKHGLTSEAAQQICELLLPATPAIAVAVTNRSTILGYAGYNKEHNRPGEPVHTTATQATLRDGKPRVLRHAEDIGLPPSSTRIHAAIVQPLFIGHNIEGTLKFYYRNAVQMSQTQESVAHGFAELLSTQMAATAFEEQAQLATSMELKALQAQINPHFLFNTINTIASLIRTDPAKAREMLRDFAAFYRSTLEDAQDLIPLERELKQVERYFSFEVARFGEDRLQLEVDVDPNMHDMLVPSFMIQPLVENSVKHGMPARGTLHVRVTGSIGDDAIVIRVEDDGVGMSNETIDNMMSIGSTTGLGIAVKNVKDRISGYFGPDSRMDVESELSVGTTVTFVLNQAIAEGNEKSYLNSTDSQQSALPDNFS